jgi:hypothetical protein
MRTSGFSAVLLIAIFLTGRAWAVDSKPATAPPHFNLPAIGEKPTAPVFSPAQLAYVQSWIRQKAPECPVAVSAAVAQDFLEDLQQRDPDKLDRLLTPDFPARQFESMLLRSVGAKLSGPSQSAAKERIAVRRVAAVLAQEGQGTTDADSQVAKLHDSSDFQYRRLLDGRMEDDELLLLLKKSGPAETGFAPTAPVRPVALTAAEIVSEFARRNQAGTAMQRLQAYAVEGQLTATTGQVQQLLLFKMRPDRFRLVLLVNGLSRYVLGADSDIFWQQTPGKKPQLAAGKDMGDRRYLAEFADPLFVRDGYTFDLLPEGGSGDNKYFRIAVKRPDGSNYVAWIEPGTYHQIGREESNASIARYSDFREVAGVTFAFREEVTGHDGHKAVLKITRITPNPGLITDFFHPAPESGFDPYVLEQFAQRVSVTASLATSSP